MQFPPIWYVAHHLSIHVRQIIVKRYEEYVLGPNYDDHCYVISMHLSHVLPINVLQITDLVIQNPTNVSLQAIPVILLLLQDQKPTQAIISLVYLLLLSDPLSPTTTSHSKNQSIQDYHYLEDL